MTNDMKELIERLREYGDEPYDVSTGEIAEWMHKAADALEADLCAVVSLLWFLVMPNSCIPNCLKEVSRFEPGDFGLLVKHEQGRAVAFSDYEKLAYENDRLLRLLNKERKKVCEVCVPSM